SDYISNIISGPGKVLVGRPDKFIFIGGSNGNWDVPDHFQPVLLPEAGETVYNGIEMETISTVFSADVIVEASGRIRMRGQHKATGTLNMTTGSGFYYATSG